MKIQELNSKNGDKTKPCDLVSEYLFHEDEGGTLSSFLCKFDFYSREEIADAIRLFIRAVSLDEYMRQKDLADFNPSAAMIKARYKRIFTDASRLDKYPTVLSGELWHCGYSRKKLADRTAKMFSTNPNEEKFQGACERIKRVYSLDDVDINKLHFFVEQVKAGEAFPNSLRRMLYIWGSEKMTGKTTSATMLVSLLNGDWNENNISRYSTNLSNEMQIRGFSVPKISECNVCLMDECFYNDMGKTYADFKRFLTSSNGRARLPFGQEFEWEGQPNYIATSNDSLQKFIKDWGDRRYLSIEFKQKPTEKLSFEEIKNLWSVFILNSTKKKDFKTWAEELAPVSDEKGDRSITTEELELELRKIGMLKLVLDLTTPSYSPACSQNQISRKTFVDWFSNTMGSAEAHKCKAEIEQAVLNVYGPRYSSTGYWLLNKLQEKARQLLDEINFAPTEAETENGKDDLPF